MIKITFLRSDAWCREKAIRTGRSCKSYQECDMSISSLSEASRVYLLDYVRGPGVYPKSIQTIYFDILGLANIKCDRSYDCPDYMLGYQVWTLTCDTDQLTPEQADTMLLEAFESSSKERVDLP